MKLPLAWLQEYVDVPADPSGVAARLAGCGFAVESVDGESMDLDVTANRPDCMSVYGLAREAATAFDLPLKPSPAAAPAASLHTAHAPIPVTVADPGCGRYALAVVDVNVGPSPTWLAERLSASGVRPINNVVDVTNYVMLEVGQPMHAFDAARLAGPEIHVRRARSGESLTTLDGETRTLDESMLVIADRDRAVALAGVMGGVASEVSMGTTRVALESAWFLPGMVRATGRKLGLKTEASARFERGADPGAAAGAIHRALTLLREINAGQATGGITDVYPRPVPHRALTLRQTRLARLLGDAVPAAEVERLLEQLGFRLAKTVGGWLVEVPSFRVDVQREVDLVEEVGRHWGLDRIPATFPALGALPRPSAPGVIRNRLVRRLLCGAGLQEAATFTFMEHAKAAPFSASGELVTITNPLSEKFGALRPSLAPGLSDSLVYNVNRQATDVRLFEIGSVFSATRGERVCAGWVLAGARGDHWSGNAGAVGFTDTKGVAELVATALGTSVGVSPAEDVPWLAAGQRARLVAGEARQAVGWIGRLSIVREIDAPIYAGEIDLDALAAHAADHATIAPLPRQPSIVRDISILVAERLPAADVRGTIRSNAPATLVTVREFDRYQGKGVPDGQVSLSVRLTFRDPQRTLTDIEVQHAVEAIVSALVREHGATLRGQIGEG